MSNIVDFRACAIWKVDACKSLKRCQLNADILKKKKKKKARNINIKTPHASEYRHEVRIKVERLISTHQSSLGLTLVFVLYDFVHRWLLPYFFV